MGSYGYTYEDKVEARFNEISMWVRDGLTEKEIAEKLEISYSNFRNYKKQHLALLALLKSSIKSNVIAEVENALIATAKGIEFEEITEELVKNTKTKEYEMKVVKKVTKRIPPNVHAQKTFLFAHKGDVYKEKQEIEHSGETGVMIINDIPRSKAK